MLFEFFYYHKAGNQTYELRLLYRVTQAHGRELIVHFFSDLFLGFVGKSGVLVLLNNSIYSFKLFLAVLLDNILPHHLLSIVRLLLRWLIYCFFEGSLISNRKRQIICLSFILEVIVVISILVIVDLGPRSIPQQLIEVDLLLVFLIFVHVGLVLLVFINVCAVHMEVRGFTCGVLSVLFLWRNGFIFYT